MSAAVRISDYMHPMLAALRANPARETDFWRDAARGRAPLIEADPA